MTVALSERIASLALDTFSRLPPRCKPRTLSDGRREWTPMSAIALSQSTDSCNVKIVALATGTKSLPVSDLAKCNGLVLHDCHAEILALRGFNYWLISEARRILEYPTSYVSDWIEFSPALVETTTVLCNTGTPAFRLREGVEISLFSTEAPCGDASMELLMSATKAAGRDVTPWPVKPEKQSDEGVKMPPGRGCFSALGALRRKPARADAEISMSKSCTDKLMLKQFTSVLAFPVSLLFELGDAVFLKRMILYKDRWNEIGYTRAFGALGRLANVLSAVDPEMANAVRFFGIETLPEAFKRFDFEKGTENQKDQKVRSSNISALWIARAKEKKTEHTDDVIEVLLNGVKQGFKQFDGRERKGSVVCRRNMIQEVCKLNGQLDGENISSPLLPETSDLASTCYSELKARSSYSKRAVIKRMVLDGLGGWPRKTHEDDFTLPILSALT